MAIATSRKYIRLRQAFANKEFDLNGKDENGAIKNR